MNHGKHSYIMIGLALVAGVLLLTGVAGGGVFVFLLVAGCAAMMFFMMRGMKGTSHDNHDGADSRMPSATDDERGP